MGEFSCFSRNELWAEGANTATLQENNLITSTQDLSPCQKFFGKGKRKILSSLQKFSEMCVMTYHDNRHQVKLANHGTEGILVSVAYGHPVGTFWVLNPKTWQINLTCDMIFLNKSYNEFNKVDDRVTVLVHYEGSNDDDDDIESIFEK